MADRLVKKEAIKLLITTNYWNLSIIYECRDILKNYPEIIKRTVEYLDKELDKQFLENRNSEYTKNY